MSQISTELTGFVQTINSNITLIGYIFAGLYTIHIINFVSGYQLNNLGIYPRRPIGLIGIVCSPWLHGNFNHLFFNSIPLFVLMTFLLQDGLLSFCIITVLIICLSGLAIWLCGRTAIHIGASSLIMGYWGYLIVDAYLHPSALDIMHVVLCLYYFGGFFSSLLPSEGTSWEGHLFGLLSGLIVGYYNLNHYIASWIINPLYIAH